MRSGFFLQANNSSLKIIGLSLVITGILFIPFIQDALAVSPIANAGGVYSGEVGFNLTLDGSGSYDSDSGDSIVQYDWRVLNDVGTIPLIALTNGGVNPIVTAAQTQSLGSGFYTVDLTVTDSTGTFSTSSVASLVLLDTTSPVVNPPANITVEATGQFTSVSIGTATAVDLGDPNPAVASDAPANYPVGTTTVTWTALDKNGNVGTATQTITVTEATPSAYVPSFPTGLTVTNVSDTTVTVSWIAPGDGGSPITGYMMEKSTVPITQMSVHEWNTNTPNTTYTYTGLTPNTEYAFDVAAVNAIGYSPPSARVTTTTSAGTTAPDIPTGLTVTGVTSTTVTVSWTAPTSDGGSPITGYMMEKSTVPITQMSVHEWNTNTPNTTYTYTGLTPNTEYAFDVATVNAIGYSPPSARVTTTTSASVSSNFTFDVYDDSPYYTNTQNGNYLEDYPTAHDGSTNVPVLCDYPNNDDFPVGTTTLNCDATNSVGQTITTSYDIIFILHTAPPTLTLPPNAEFTFRSDGFVGWFSPTIQPGVESEIGNVVYLNCIDSTNGELVYPLSDIVDGYARYEIAITEGIHTITCTGTDIVGNTISDSYTVTFVDNGIVGATGVIFDAVSAIFVETNASGEIVTFTNPIAYDTVSGINIPSTCSPASGTLFAIGTVTVTCTAINSAGDSGEVKFNVDVRLPDSVRMNLPTDTTISATGSDGVTFNYDVYTISDSASSAQYTCEPASGSKFPIGTTLVTCNATVGAATATDSFVVTVYDPDKIQQTQSKTSISLSEQPQGIAVNPNSNTFYVATINPFTGTSNIHFIDGNTHSISNSIPISSLIEAIDVNPITNIVYAIDGNTLYVIDGSSKTLKTQITISENSQAKAEKITVNSKTNTIYISGYMGSGYSLVIVDGNTNQLLNDYWLGRTTPHDIHYEPTTNKLYMRLPNIALSYDGTTGIHDNNNITIPQDSGNPGDNNAYEFAYMVSTGKVYTNSYQQDIISIVDYTSKSSETINIAKPIDLDINSKTNQIFVVSDSSPGVVTIFDGNKQILKTVTVGSKPTEIVVNDATNIAYVLNQGDSTISIIGEPEKPRPPVPDWLKTNVEWWADGAIDDNSFKDGISFMIKENIIAIDDLPEASGVSESAIPDWIKQNAKWWADGTIGEADFINGLKYMVEKGIIGVN